jgi:polygalacturonase
MRRLRLLTQFLSFVFLGILPCVFLLGCANQKSQTTSSQTIVDDIKTPVIPNLNVNLSDIGGKGDSTTDNKPFIDKAIADLKTQGGGMLTIPKGVYLIDGSIRFISNFELHLDSGAVIRFGSKPSNYLPVVKTSWEGTFLYNYSPFIYAYQCKNIAISGFGTIDGESSDTWSKWTSLQTADQMLSREMNHKNVPVESRVFGEGHFLRPQLIQFFECENIKVENVKIEDSPFWCIHLLKCNNATISGVRYDAQNKNNDGIDPEYSRNILIEKVLFNNGDDNVAIKAGRDNEGRLTNIPSENIVIRNCSFKGLHAIVIGSEMSAGVQNVFVENCTSGGYLKRGIYLKSNPDRGGFIRNIYFKNIDFGEVEDCFYITSFYHQEGEGFATEISNINVEQLHCSLANGTVIVIQGFPALKVHDVFLNQLHVDSATNAISMVDAENIVMSDVVIGKSALPPSFVK